MIWQDVVIAVCQWVFIIALFPSVLGKDKPALSTSVMTGLVLVVLAATFATLSLWSSGFSALLLGTLWFTLAVQKYSQTKQDKKKVNNEVI